MTNLADLQKNFIHDCLSGKLTDDTVLLQNDVNTEFISAKGLMGIYQQSSIANIMHSMKLTYPVIEKLVGHDFFNGTCRQFIRLHWPITANMEDYGFEFANFLEEFKHTRQITYLSDVARLEWLFHQSSLADDSITIDWLRLSQVPADDALALKFVLAPSVRLFSSSFPVNDIWQMNQECSLDDPNSSVNINLESSQKVSLLLFRKHLKVDILVVTPEEFALLELLMNKQTLANAIEVVATVNDTCSLDDLIQKYIELGVICGFTVE